MNKEHLQKLKRLGLTRDDVKHLLTEPDLLGTGCTDMYDFFGWMPDSLWVQSLESRGFFREVISDRTLLIDRERNLLVKRMYINHDPTKLLLTIDLTPPKKCVPTWVVRVIETTFVKGMGAAGWVLCVQPVVDCSTEAQTKAWQEASQIPFDERHALWGRDVAPRNLGLWRDRSVVFDF